jgi:hypothetical protein
MTKNPLFKKRDTPMQSVERIAKERGTTPEKLIEEANKLNAELNGSGSDNLYLIIGGSILFLVIVVVVIVKIKKRKK